MSNPEALAAQAAHQALMELLDIHSIHKTFRNPQWRPNQRRNKNLKTILGDASRKEVSVNATPADISGTTTPVPEDGLSTSGTSTPALQQPQPSASGAESKGNGTAAAGAASSQQPNLAQASRSLSKLVLEKSLNQSSASSRHGAGNAHGGGGGASSAPTATYTNVESAPSLAPQKHYCDVTGLPAPYLDPKTRLRYHDREVFAMIRSLPQGVTEQFLEARGAQTVLK